MFQSFRTPAGKRTSSPETSSRAEPAARKPPEQDGKAPDEEAATSTRAPSAAAHPSERSRAREASSSDCVEVVAGARSRETPEGASEDRRRAWSWPPSTRSRQCTGGNSHGAGAEVVSGAGSRETPESASEPQSDESQMSSRPPGRRPSVNSNGVPRSAPASEASES